MRAYARIVCVRRDKKVCARDAHAYAEAHELQIAIRRNTKGNIEINGDKKYETSNFMQ